MAQHADEPDVAAIAEAPTPVPSLRSARIIGNRWADE